MKQNIFKKTFLWNTMSLTIKVKELIAIKVVQRTLLFAYIISICLANAQKSVKFSQKSQMRRKIIKMLLEIHFDQLKLTDQ